jgi:hypothetical protein
MKDLHIALSKANPEMFARARGEIFESKGDVSLFLASGEEVPAIKGTKLYLNDRIVSREDSAVLASFGATGVLVLGQNQQMPLYSDFFHQIESLEQVGIVDTFSQFDGIQLDDVIDMTALELAIQAGQNIEALTGGSAANEYGDASTVIFYQRYGDWLIPVYGFDDSNSGCARISTSNDFGDIHIHN